MLENGAESHQSAARFVGQPCANQNADRKPEPLPMSRQARQSPDQILQRTLLLTNDQKVQTYKHAGDSKTKQRQTKTLILQNLTLPKNDNANEPDKFYELNLPETLQAKDLPIWRACKANRDLCRKKLT